MSPGIINAPVTGAPIPPTPGDYPASVIAKGLQAVWDTQYRSAPAPYKVLGVDPTPPGWNYLPGDHLLGLDVDGEWEDWDLRGVSIYGFTSTSKVLKRCLIGATPRSDYIIRNGDDGSSVNSSLSLQQCKVDCSSPTISWGGVLSRQNSFIEAIDCNFVNANLDHVTCYEGNFSGCYFGSFMQNCGLISHAEQVYANALVTMLNCFLDARGSTFIPSSGNAFASTGGVYQFNQVIMAGIAASNSIYTTQEGPTSTMDFVNCVLEKGIGGGITNGYIAKNGGGATSSGSISYTDSSSIDAYLEAV